MNAKLVKKMRRVARRLTVGMPDRRLIGKRVECGPPTHRYVRVQAVNDPKTTRGVYRQIKKGHKAEVRRMR